MDQISRPFQIVLALTLAFAALYMVALRPKEEAPPAPPPPPSQAASKSAIPGAPGDALDKAREAQRQGAAGAAQRPGQIDGAAEGIPGAAAQGGTRAAGAPAGGPGSGDPGARRVPAGRGFATPQRVESALASRRAVVLLFYSSRASDDRAVRSELAGVSRRGGRVVVMAASIRGVSRFGRVTRGVQILQSPTVVVIGPSRQARTFTGFTDRTEIDQAVATALRR